MVRRATIKKVTLENKLEGLSDRDIQLIKDKEAELLQKMAKSFQLRDVNDLRYNLDYHDDAKFKFQRPLNLKKVKKIARSMAQKGALPYYPILIDKDNYVIDGQHRVAAAKMLGITYVYVYVMSKDLDESGARVLFKDLNDFNTSQSLKEKLNTYRCDGNAYALLIYQLHERPTSPLYQKIDLIKTDVKIMYPTFSARVFSKIFSALLCTPPRYEVGKSSESQGTDTWAVLDEEAKKISVAEAIEKLTVFFDWCLGLMPAIGIGKFWGISGNGSGISAVLKLYNFLNHKGGHELLDVYKAVVSKHWDWTDKSAKSYATEYYGLRDEARIRLLLECYNDHLPKNGKVIEYVRENNEVE